MEGGRNSAIEIARQFYDSGAFFNVLKRRVRYRTESQKAEQSDVVRAYLSDEIAPSLAQLGFTSRIVPNAEQPLAPFMLASRIEDPALPTLLTYAHGDVVNGHDEQWKEGLSPWNLTAVGNFIYGRGSADNKGQHTINLAALAAVIEARGGTLGFNVKLILETGEEIGSPGLQRMCTDHAAELAADLFIASDGPRVGAERPTVFLGSRGCATFELTVNLREGGHHSGNWGGALKNPGIVLAHALASLVDARGTITVESLRPPPIPVLVKAALADITLGSDENAPDIDINWGEPGLSPAERVIAWNSLEVLAVKTGNPDAPVNAIPPSAKATCQLRYVVGTDTSKLCSILQEHLIERGFGDVKVKVIQDCAASRLDPESPWVKWALSSLGSTSGKNVALLPNLGGWVPNDVFAHALGIPTLWVPHSYPACAQHAPNEHLLGSVAREALAIMAGLWWDLAADGAAILADQAHAGKEIPAFREEVSR